MSRECNNNAPHPEPSGSKRLFVAVYSKNCPALPAIFCELEPGESRFLLSPEPAYWICTLNVTTPWALGARLPVKVQLNAPDWPAAGPVALPLVRPAGVVL